MRSKYVVGNKYSIVKYWLILNHFVVATASLITSMYVCNTQEDAHSEDNILGSLFSTSFLRIECF
jgi:hypothetical protein